MERRGFFKRLMGLAATPIAAKVAASEEPEPKTEVINIDLSATPAGWHRTITTANVVDEGFWQIAYSKTGAVKENLPQDNDQVRKGVLLQATESGQGEGPTEARTFGSITAQGGGT